MLVHAAAGGVGLAATQIAKAKGATVIGTAGSAEKRAVAKRFGADYVVDYRDDDWPDKVKKLTPGGRGVDIVYDPVGLVEKSIKCTAWAGRLLVIGFAAGKIEKVALNRVLLKNISIMGLHWGAYAKNDMGTIIKVWMELLELISEDKFKSTCFTDQTFSGLESVPRALEALSGRDTWGKVVVNVAAESTSRL